MCVKWKFFVCSLCGYRKPEGKAEINTLLYWKKGDTVSIKSSAIEDECTDHHTESKKSRIKKLLLSRDVIAVMYKSMGLTII
jgi:hypothetical protein